MYPHEMFLDWLTGITVTLCLSLFLYGFYASVFGCRKKISIGVPKKFLGKTVELKRAKFTKTSWISIFNKPSMFSITKIALVYDCSPINLSNIRKCPTYPPKYSQFVDKIKIKGIQNKRWMEVELLDGNVGYIDIAYLNFEDLSVVEEENVAKDANDFLLGFEELKSKDFVFATNFQKRKVEI